MARESGVVLPKSKGRFFFRESFGIAKTTVPSPIRLRGQPK
jgi:hypothetical protein